MSRQYLVRVGAMGRVGRFAAVDAAHYPRSSRVVVRTVRGLETGEVLAPAAESDSSALADGELLRKMTPQDELLEARLIKNRDAAYQACAARIAAANLPATLLDVEHLFDGGSLFFYFLGEASGELDRLLGELAEVYDGQAQFRRFAEAVEQGCGPDCGAEGTAGQGCHSCGTSCAVAGLCGSRTAS